MAEYSAVAAARRPKTRAKRPSYDPIETRAKWLADALWESAMKIANVLAPQNPVGQQELPPFDQWVLLETVAMNLSPGYWDEPSAIEDLYKLRTQFLPPKEKWEWLQVLARERVKESKGLPDPSITPQNPEFRKRLGKV